MMPETPRRCLTTLAIAGLACGAPFAAAAPMLAPVSSGVVTAADEPEVFSDRGLEADRAAAIEAGKLHLVYATASWCPPCQRMKTTTWVDQGVVDWLGKNAVVTPLDVDEFRSEAQGFRVRAMPTMMLFEGETELGRTVGFQSAEGLVSWLESTSQQRTGNPGEAHAEAEAEAPDTSTPMGRVQSKMAAVTPACTAAFDRLTKARAMVEAGELDEATEAYASLWIDSKDGDAAFARIRSVEMVNEIRDLAESHPAARERFAAIHNADDVALKNRDVTWVRLHDWIALNTIVGRQDLTVRYADMLKDRRSAPATFERFARELVLQCGEQNELGMITTIVPDPIATAEAGLAEAMTIAELTGESAEDDALLLTSTLAPAIASAVMADDDGASVDALVAYLESVAGENQTWRAAFVVVASACGKLTDEQRSWINEHNLQAALDQISAG